MHNVTAIFQPVAILQRKNIDNIGPEYLKATKPHFCYPFGNFHLTSLASC